MQFFTGRFICRIELWDRDGFTYRDSAPRRFFLCARHHDALYPGTACFHNSRQTCAAGEDEVSPRCHHMSRRCHRVSQKCRGSVVQVSQSVSDVSSGVADVSRMCRGCVADVSRMCRGCVNHVSQRCRKVSQRCQRVSTSHQRLTTGRHVDILSLGWGVDWRAAHLRPRPLNPLACPVPSL